MNIIAPIVGAIFFLIFLRCVWDIFKYIYIVHVRFGPYMEQHHAAEWEEMNKDFSCLPWKAYDARVILCFIWKSGETFGDENINVYRKKLKYLRKEFLLLIISIPILVLALAFLAIWLNGPNPAFVSPSIK